MRKKLLFAIPIMAALLWGATSGNIQWTQLASSARHGSAGTKGQSSDGTGTNAHGACFNSTGDLTDCGSAPSGGTVTSVVAGPCLQGGTITSTGTISSIGSCYIAGGGTANAQTATYSPAVASLISGLNLCWLPSNANTATTPTFSPNSLTAKTIIKVGGAALAASDLTTTAIACAIYDGTTWELQNPQTATGGGIACTGSGICVGGASAASNSPSVTTSVTSPAFIGSGSDPYVNLPSNTGHSASSGDFWNNAGVLQFNTGSGTVQPVLSLTTTGSSGAATLNSSGVLNVPQYSGGATASCATTQTVVTGSRALSTVYHNTNAVPICLLVWLNGQTGGNTTGLVVESDSSATPTTAICAASTGIGGTTTLPVAACEAVILAGNYYEVINFGTNTGTLTGAGWIETK